MAGTASRIHEFDRDTAVEPLGGGRYRGEITDRWDVVGGAPNGGYLVTLGLRAIAADLSAAGFAGPDPLSSTAHFVARGAAGRVDVDVDVVRAGRRHATATARLIQGGDERLRLLATFGDLAGAAGPTHVTGAPPDLPPLEECLSPPEGLDLPPIVRRFDARMVPETVGWAVGQPSGEAHIAGWVRFADGRPADTLSLPLFADAMPPTALNVVDEVVWVPTVELTVHARGRPADGWLRGAFRTRFLKDGYLEEDGEVWDADDNLVALSRQLAMVRTG